MHFKTAQILKFRYSGSILIPLTFVFVLVLIGIFGILFAANRKIQPTAPKEIVGQQRDSIKIGYPATVFGIFPNSTPDFYDVVFNNNIFDGLGKITNGQVKPALAESWTNPDQTTWRFNLKRGVKFHNGDPFTASDVKFSIDQALKEKWPNAFNLSTVKSVEVINSYTLEIKTTNPDPVLLNRLVYAFIVSEKQFKEKDNKQPAVGTGPYKFVSLDKERAILEVNDDYYLGKPKIGKVIYKFFLDETTDEQKLEALLKAEVDLVSVDEPKVGQKAQADFQVKTLADPFITFLFLDTARETSPYVDKTPNPLKNKLVRQAIYKVINISAVVQEADLSAIPASQLVTDAIFGFNQNIKRPEPGIEEAKRLISQAGYAEGFGLTLEIVKNRIKEAEAVAKQLGKINIKVKVVGIDGDKLFDKFIVKKDTSAFIIDYAAETFDAGEIFVNVLHTAKETFGKDNLTNYSNAEIDKLTEEIPTTFDSSTRKEKLQQAMVKAMAEMPMVPLYNREFFYIINPSFHWTPTTFGAIYANEISGRQVIKN